MLKITKPNSSRSLASFCAKMALEKIAKNILILNLTSIESAPSDYFVICTCDSETQMRAILDAILRKCTELGITKPKVEGFNSKHWILLDMFDVVMHIMLKETRDFYNIEKLWGDAKFLEISEAGRLISLKEEK